MKLSRHILHELEKIGKSINVEEYKFLDTNPDLHTPVLIGLGGSHAYGTNIETSDLDIRGIALHSKKDILLKGEICTYREKEHDLLMSIRNGDYLGEDGRPNAEFFDLVHEYEARLDYAKEHSVLPDKPAAKRIEKFLMKANEKMLSERTTKEIER